MTSAVFSFKYRTSGTTNELDAYDAAEALYGISRSISIITHYVVNGKVIKQAPSLKGAHVLVQPPVKGSFEFIIPVIQALVDPANLSAVSQGIESSVLYDLTKVLYRRLAGRSEETSSQRVDAIVRHQSGDVDALADSIGEDLVRIQRPIGSEKGSTFNIKVSGGTVNIVNFDRDTYDYAKTKVRGEFEEEFLGHVQSFNGSTNQGRFWVEAEERTVGFSVNKTSRLSVAARRSLSWSLDQWVSQLEGFLNVTGYPLSSKTGLLKHIFVTGVKRA